MRHEAKRREGALKRWLSKPPDGWCKLALVSERGDPIHVWAQEQVAPILSLEILDLVADYAQESSRRRYTATLVFVGEDDEPLAQRKVHYRAPGEGDVDSENMHRRVEYDGSPADIVVQCQNHLETMMRVHVGSQAAVLGQLTSTMERFAQMHAEAQRDLRTRDREVVQLRKQLAELQGSAAADDDDDAPDYLADPLVREAVKAFTSNLLGKGDDGGEA